jgi:hypothetical protein
VQEKSSFLPLALFSYSRYPSGMNWFSSADRPQEERPRGKSFTALRLTPRYAARSYTGYGINEQERC